PVCCQPARTALASTHARASRFRACWSPHSHAPGTPRKPQPVCAGARARRQCFLFVLTSVPNGTTLGSVMVLSGTTHALCDADSRCIHETLAAVHSRCRSTCHSRAISVVAG